MNGTAAASGRSSWPKWAGTAVTIAIAALAFSAQWGVVTAKLNAIEQRMADFVSESRAVRTDVQNIGQRVSCLEGKVGVRADKQ